VTTKRATRNLTQPLDDIRPTASRLPPQKTVLRAPARPETALVLDVRRLQLLGALQEGSMGQLVWGSAGQRDRASALYSFDSQILTLHEILRDGSLDRIEASLPVEASAAFARSGSRPWLACPNARGGGACKHRATKLHLVAGETCFKCRYCVGRRRRLRLAQITEATSHALGGRRPRS
jgi:hypothetical protein